MCSLLSKVCEFGEKKEKEAPPPRRMSGGDDDPEKRRLKLRQEQEEALNLKRYSRLSNFHRDLVAGAVMGGVVHTIVAPIERAKLLLQTQESNLAIVASGRRKFKGMLDCIARTVREEGILSLWRGNGSSVLRYYPSVALNFSLKVSSSFPFSTLPLYFFCLFFFNSFFFVNKFIGSLSYFVFCLLISFFFNTFACFASLLLPYHYYVLD